jgi:thiamine-phosphate pyrophosphorylase
MTIDKAFGFYAILTDPIRGYDYCSKVLVDHGIRFVQLRMKDRPVSEISRVADLMRKITSGSATRLIINDYPNIAKECSADGVHIGQDDLSYSEARAIVGEESIIGISTHNPEQTAAACAVSPDYIGIGPVFQTPTKKNPDPVIGLSGLKTMLQVATVPAVAIGGIDLNNLHKVLETGAKNFCMVRRFTQSESPEKIIKEIKKIYVSFYPEVL